MFSIHSYLRKGAIDNYDTIFCVGQHHVDEIRETRSADGKQEFTIILNDGENRGEYKGDMLLVATGRRPNISQLRLENTDVEVSRGNVVVNDYLQTKVPNIFAINFCIA